MNLFKRIKFALTPRHMRCWTVRRVYKDGTVEVPMVPPPELLKCAGPGWDFLAGLDPRHGWLMPQEWAEYWATLAAPPWRKNKHAHYIVIRIK